ncbi:MAG: DNA methyltransferase, partial [Nitrososphaerota archaeon]
LKKPKRDVFKSLLAKAERVLFDGIPAVRGQAYMCDARHLPLEDESVDLVVTSPPYFNMQTYAWDNWLRLWFLGYDYEEIGKKLFHTNSLQKFKEFIKDCLTEFYRVLKMDKAAVIVLGAVKLNGRIVNMAEEVAPIAEEIGFNVISIISDSIPRSSKYLYYLDEEQGVSKEVILVLAKGEVSVNNVEIDWSHVKPTSVINQIVRREVIVT